MQSVWWDHASSLSGKGENASLNFMQFSRAPGFKEISSLNWCGLKCNRKGHWNARRVRLFVCLVALFGWDWTIISLSFPKWWRVCVSEVCRKWNATFQYFFWPFLLCCFIWVLDFVMLREWTTVSMSIGIHFHSRSRIQSPVTVIHVHYIHWQYLFIHLFIQTFIYVINIHWAQAISSTLLINRGGGQVNKSKVSPTLEKWASKPRGMTWIGRLGSTKGWSFDTARPRRGWLYFLVDSSSQGSWSKVDLYRNNPEVHRLMPGEMKRGLSYRDYYIWSYKGTKWHYLL